MFHIINKDKMKFIIAGSFINLCPNPGTSSEPTEEYECYIDVETGIEWCKLVPVKKTCKG